MSIVPMVPMMTPIVLVVLIAGVGGACLQTKRGRTKHQSASE